MIDIIIPCYNAHKTLDSTLLSICSQTIKDKCKILLVNDYSNEGYESFINKYKKYIDISVLNLEKNMGPGAARREGINHTNSKYIVFMDSDDLFYSVDSLQQLYSKIEEGYDLVNSLEYDEKREAFLLLNGNVHGKIYRRSYLNENNITFNNTRYHEDNFFNNYVILSGVNLYELDNCTYYYVYNQKSITNVGAEFERLEIYLSNTKDLLDIAKKKHFNEYLVKQFKVEKYRYLSRIYKDFNSEEKNIFNKWVNKYDKEILDYLDLDRDEIYNKIME